MKRAGLLLLLLVIVASFVGGCRGPKPSGSREFIPGKGWLPTE